MTGDGSRTGRRSLIGRAAAVAAVVAALAVVAAAVGQPTDRDRAGLGLDWATAILGFDAALGALAAGGLLLLLAIVWALVTGPSGRRVRLRREPMAIATVVTLAVALLIVWQLERAGLGGGLARLLGGMELPDEVEDVPQIGRAGAAVDSAARRAANAAGAALLLAGAGVWWWWRRARRVVEEEEEPEASAATARLAEAVEAALDDADQEPDPRRAILRCYAHLESALTEAGCPRRPAETPREHRYRAAAQLGLAAQAAARLVDRFERARYDAAPITGDDRREAIAALQEVRSALAAPQAQATRQPSRSPSVPSGGRR